jgi:hypothetical protein
MTAWWRSRESLYALTIFFGLFIDQNGTEWTIKGEYIVNVAVWSIFARLYFGAAKKERIEMITVLAFATPMELFFSEVWNLYEYREGLMPLFVPAGHWFLFDLGRRLCKYISHDKAWLVISPFIPATLVFLILGIDTSGVVLLLILLAFMKWGSEPSLYAMMAWIALLMELWGTYLGNWTWAHDIPWTPLVAWNPPLLCGVFYALGDLLVCKSVKKWHGE